MQRLSQESIDEFDGLKNIVGTFPRGFSGNINFAYPLVRAGSLVTLNVTTQAEGSGKWDALGIAVLAHQVNDAPAF